ncbi:MAG TPA: rRNA adenine N-6-methyltransferase family protein, partial [Candidatus Poseidoniia archaeon]|nr:rRNA adenine N-6-methyltransferase family protein [Candidatus Poseidoniia archaeon]
MSLSPRRRKALGQHFLVDEKLADSIVAAAEIAPGERILEIGPGRGVLTER